MSTPKVLLFLFFVEFCNATTAVQLAAELLARDAFPARFFPCTDPILNVPNGGYLCTNQPFVLELNFSGTAPFTFTYTLDGIAQAPVTTSDTSFILSVTSAEYQDSVVITNVSSEDCMGAITGLPYIRIVEPIANTSPIVDCDENNQTYTVSFQLSGGMFNYIPVDPASGFINGNTFSSQPIPLAQDYLIQMTSGLNCDTLTVTGTPNCADPCQGFAVSAVGNGPICAGEDILLMAQGAETYSWTGPANFASSEQNPLILNVARAFSGSYQVIAGNAVGCLDTATVEVIVNDLPSFNNVDLTPLTCENNTTTITIEAGGAGTLEYAIDDPLNFGTSNIFPDLTVGGYDLFVRDQNGCIGTYSLTILPQDGPVITSLIVSAPGCGLADGSIQIMANGDNQPLIFSIDGGVNFQNSGLFNNLSGGDYAIVVQDTAGCTISATATLAGGGDPPVVDQILIEQAACAADQNSIAINVLSNSNNLSYSINGIDFQSGRRFTGLFSGVYMVTVRDESGCSVTETVVIPAIDPLVIENVEVRPADCRGNGGRITLAARGGTGPLLYSLNDTLSQNNPVFNGLAPGIYRISVTDGSGCNLSREISIIRGECPLYIANVFSPNGDGVNDEFAIYAAGGINGQVIVYQIFSRWGEMLFQSGGFPLGASGQWWDGTLRGQAAPSGVYVYNLVIELDGGEQISNKGEVNLIR